MELFDKIDIIGMFESIKVNMIESKEVLIELDAQNGDGDLGLSMTSGFIKTCEILSVLEETDLGKIFLTISKTFNEVAPSTLGTLLSIGFMGMAKAYKGKSSVNAIELSMGFEKALEAIMDKGGAKPGEKTIIDSLYPAIKTLKEEVIKNIEIIEIFEAAEKAGYEGMEKTREMKSVHGRAAYYGDSSIGILDGGAMVGMLFIKGCKDYFYSKYSKGEVL